MQNRFRNGILGAKEDKEIFHYNIVETVCICKFFRYKDVDIDENHYEGTKYKIRILNFLPDL